MFGVDDYPWRNDPPNQTNPLNCGYAKRNCTDFAMFRWRHDLGQPCGFFGSARTWALLAARAGYAVSGRAAAHVLMQLDPGEQSSDPVYGHVCAVLEVGPSIHVAAGHVIVEQYNWLPYRYSTGIFAITARTHFIYPTQPPAPPPPPPPSEDTDVLSFVVNPGDPRRPVAGFTGDSTINLTAYATTDVQLFGYDPQGGVIASPLIHVVGNQPGVAGPKQSSGYVRNVLGKPLATGPLTIVFYPAANPYSVSLY